MGRVDLFTFLNLVTMLFIESRLCSSWQEEMENNRVHDHYVNTPFFDKHTSYFIENTKKGLGTVVSRTDNYYVKDYSHFNINISSITEMSSIQIPIKGQYYNLKKTANYRSGIYNGKYLDDNEVTVSTCSVKCRNRNEKRIKGILSLTTHVFSKPAERAILIINKKINVTRGDILSRTNIFAWRWCEPCEEVSKSGKRGKLYYGSHLMLTMDIYGVALDRNFDVLESGISTSVNNMEYKINMVGWTLLLPLYVLSTDSSKKLSQGMVDGTKVMAQIASMRSIPEKNSFQISILIPKMRNDVIYDIYAIKS